MGSIPIVGWAMVLSIKYIKGIRVISVLMDVDMFVEDVKRFLKDNKGHEEVIISLVLNIMNIKEHIMGN